MTFNSAGKCTTFTPFQVSELLWKLESVAWKMKCYKRFLVHINLSKEMFEQVTTIWWTMLAQWEELEKSFLDKSHNSKYSRRMTACGMKTLDTSNWEDIWVLETILTGFTMLRCLISRWQLFQLRLSCHRQSCRSQIWNKFCVNCFEGMWFLWLFCDIFNVVKTFFSCDCIFWVNYKINRIFHMRALEARFVHWPHLTQMRWRERGTTEKINWNSSTMQSSEAEKRYFLIFLTGSWLQCCDQTGATIVQWL